MPRIVGLQKTGKVVGEIVKLGLGSLPFGFLPCDGSAVSRTTYSTLFAQIGTTYGTGDGSTTFNVPDFRGRAPMGDGHGAGLTSRTVGQQVGGETTVISTANLPAHTHGVGTITVAGSGDIPHTHGYTDPGHSHTQNAHSHSGNTGTLPAAPAQSISGSVNSNTSDPGWYAYTWQSAAQTSPLSIASTTATNQSNTTGISISNNATSLNHTHTLSGSTDNGGLTTNSGLAVVSPSLVVKFGIAYT